MLLQKNIIQTVIQRNPALHTTEQESFSIVLNDVFRKCWAKKLLREPLRTLRFFRTIFSLINVEFLVSSDAFEYTLYGGSKI